MDTYAALLDFVMFLRSAFKQLILCFQNLSRSSSGRTSASYAECRGFESHPRH